MMAASARALIVLGCTELCQSLSSGLACALNTLKHRPGDWQDGIKKRQTDDADVLERIHGVIGEAPTYVYRRVWALLRRQSEAMEMALINANRVYPAVRPVAGAGTEKNSGTQSA